MANPGTSLQCCIIALLMIFAVCTFVSADQAETPTALDIGECISVALAQNTDVLTAENNVLAAKSRSASAMSSYFPQLSLQNNAFVWGSDSVLERTTTGTALTVNQSVWDGGLREANTQRARHEVTQSAAGLSRTQQTIIFNVSNAYYELLRAKRLASVAYTNVTYNESLRDQVQARAKEGEAARIDVLPIEAQLASARVSLLSAQSKVRSSAIQLQSVMGLETRQGFDIRDVSDEPKIEIGSLEDYLETGLKSRPDVLQSKAAADASRSSVRSARINLYPRPVISANYQRQVSGGFSSSGTQMVGGVVFDIFNGGANRAAYKEAKVNQSNAKLQEQQLGRDIQSQVEDAFLNLTTTKQRMEASVASLEAANVNYQAQQERYSLGLGTTLDLLNAEVQAITAQSDNVQALYDYHIAVAQMEYAVGQGGVK